MPEHVPFKRVVVTGVENSGKTTFAKLLARELHWPMVEEHARRHQAVLNGAGERRHVRPVARVPDRGGGRHRPCRACWGCLRHGRPRLAHVVRASVGLQLAPVVPPWPSVDLHILCPTLEVWEEDPLRSMPRLEDRLALEAQYRAHLEHRHHLVAEGDTPEARVAHILAQWPW